MTRTSGLCAATLCLVAAPAMADVTPGDVWRVLDDMLSGMGYEVSADPEQQDDALVLRDLRLVSQVEGMTPITQTLGTVTLRDNGDGSVAVETPED